MLNNGTTNLNIVGNPHFCRDKKEKAHTWTAKVTLEPLGVLEERETCQVWSSTETPHAKLPSPVVPCFHKSFCGMTWQRLMERLAQAVAKEAHVRALKSEHDEKQLCITEGCLCVFCANHPPHQTHDYQKLRIQQVLEPSIAGSSTFYRFRSYQLASCLWGRMYTCSFFVKIPSGSLPVPGMCHNFLLIMAIQSCNGYRFAFFQLPQLAFIVDHASQYKTTYTCILDYICRLSFCSDV
jgi:hypothetical protein